MIETVDQEQTLLKFQPLPLSTLPLDHEIHSVRKSFYYVYVINWLANYRAYLRLTSEYFDVDLFEMELLNLFNPPPLDESVLFISKLKNSINHSLSGNKNLDFDESIRKLFRDSPLEHGNFDTIPLIERFETLYVVLDHISGLANFRSFIDRNELQLNFKILKTEIEENSKIEWFLILDKLYKKITVYPELIIPISRKQSPENPEEVYAGKFDISLSQISFEIELWTLEDYNKFIPNVRKNSHFKSFKTPEFHNFIVNSEIKRRRNIFNKKKEYQLINLMATRKKSSRLQAKELEKQSDNYERQTRREKEFRKALESGKVNKRLNYNGTLSREDRLKARALNTAFAKGMSSSPTFSDDMDHNDVELVDNEVEHDEENLVDENIRNVENGDESIEVINVDAPENQENEEK